MIFAVSAAVVAAFVLGKVYGARVEKMAVAVAIGAVVKAKTILFSELSKAQAVAKAEVDRLEALAKKYL